MLDQSALFEIAPVEETLSEKAVGDELGFKYLHGITDIEVWDNFTDDELYELDKAVRNWLKKIDMSKQYKGGYRTTASLVFLWIFGREPDQYNDIRILRKLKTLLSYYCQEVKHQTKVNYRAARNVYVFHRNGGNKMAYSIRLRLEMHESGEKVLSDKFLFSYGINGVKF